MDTTLKKQPTYGSGFAERLWSESWIYLKTVVDTVREPFLVLDKDLCVLAANDAFYQTFQVDKKDTETHLLYELGSGQWNISELRKLLEDILPYSTSFKGFEVTHVFPRVGRKVMILNARQIYREGTSSSEFPQIIFLAMEDVTEMMDVADMLSRHTKQFQSEMTNRTEKLEFQITELEKEISVFKQL
jgi:nitrogen-specific signal transduction histidine kinase